MITVLLLVSVCAATGLELMQSPYSLRLLVGDTANFDCTLHHTGEVVSARFYWHFTKEIFGELHTGNISTKSGDGRFIVSGISSPGFRSFLTIKNLEFADSGMYYCNAITSLSRNTLGAGTRLTVEAVIREDHVLTEIRTNLNNILSVLRYILFVLLLCYFICVEKF